MIQYAAGFVAVVLLLVALWFGALNGYAAFLNRRNRLSGIKRHYSPIPFPQLLVILAAIIAAPAHLAWLPRWVFVLVALSDFFLWQMCVIWPLAAVWRGLLRLLATHRKAQ